MRPSPRAATISAIVCAYNEAPTLPACLQSLLAQSRPPDEVIVVNNASTDETATVARRVPGVRVLDEPTKGLVVARETARLAASGDILAYVDADCRAPLQWLEHVERRFARYPALVAVTGPYRFYDWDLAGRALIRAYDTVVAPPTHALVHYGLGIGAVLYGGNFAVRREALQRIGGFDRALDFHGEDTNLGRRLTPIGSVQLAGECWVWTVHTKWSDGRLSLREVIDLYGHGPVRRYRDHRPYPHGPGPPRACGPVDHAGDEALFSDRGLLRRLHGGHRSRKNSHIVALNLTEYISADQPAADILQEIRRQGAFSIACHPHFIHTIGRRGGSRSARATYGTTATAWSSWWMCGRRRTATICSR